MFQKRGNDFLKWMMIFLRCYGWIYFPLSLFLFWVFRLSFVKFLLRQILSHIKALRTENVENTCTVDINSVYFRFIYLFLGCVVALGRQFTEPLSADAALSSLCGAKRPAQYKSNSDQKWISIQQCCDKILTNNKYFTLCTNVTVYLFSSHRKSN